MNFKVAGQTGQVDRDGQQWLYWIWSRPTARTMALSASKPTMPLFEPPSPSHRVHFETTCVVIPEVAEEPIIHLAKRNFSLPSWRRQRPDESKSTEAPHPAVITVTVPSLSRKHRRMHSSERVPLQPCLRHSHSVSCSNVDSNTASNAAESAGTAIPPPSPTAFDRSHRIPMASRRSMPSSVPAVDRVPLRECCTTCLDSVDNALKTDYHEHWSTGAQRRRRMSESEAAKPSTCSSTFLRKPVRVDEVDGRKCRRRPNAPIALPPALLEHLCQDDDDESMLFPLPSPRRTPVSGTPLLGTPSSTPPKLSTSRTPSPARTPSPRSIAHALEKSQQSQGISQSAQKPLPQLPTGKHLLSQFPDVDALPSRRAASDSATNTSPPRRPMHSLLRTISPALGGL